MSTNEQMLDVTTNIVTKHLKEISNTEKLNLKLDFNLESITGEEDRSEIGINYVVNKENYLPLLKLAQISQHEEIVHEGNLELLNKVINELEENDFENKFKFKAEYRIDQKVSCYEFYDIYEYYSPDYNPELSIPEQKGIDKYLLGFATKRIIPIAINIVNTCVVERTQKTITKLLDNPETTSVN